MHKFYLIIFLLIFCKCFGQLEEFKPRTFWGVSFKGRIEMVEFYKVNFTDIGIPEKMFLQTTGIFDSTGQLVVERRNDLNGNPFLVKKRIFKNGIQLELIDSIFDKAGLFESLEIIRLDKQGLIFTKRIFSNQGIPGISYRIMLDKKLREIKRFERVGNKMERLVSATKYFNNGKEIELISYSGSGNVDGIRKYFLDSNMLRVKETFQEPGSKTFYIVDYKHDKVGNVINEFRRKSDGSYKNLWEYAYTYDTNDNITEIVALRNGKTVFRNIFKIKYY